MSLKSRVEKIEEKAGVGKEENTLIIIKAFGNEKSETVRAPELDFPGFKVYLKRPVKSPEDLTITNK
jgi:hypothetical protein